MGYEPGVAYPPTGILPQWWIIPLNVRVPYLEGALRAVGPLLGAINPWSPQAIAAKAAARGYPTVKTPQPPLKPVEDTRGPVQIFDEQMKALLDALAGVARATIIPDVGIGPIVDPRVIVPEQVPQAPGGAY